ncbi:MAG TPA: hypothetical protein VFZ36_09570 [Vicinamibacterales bacterium]
MRRPVVLAVAAVLLSAWPAAAQARKGSWEIAPGAIWFSGADLGGSEATLERPDGGEFVLFRTDTRLEGAFAPAVTLSVYLAPRLAVEAGFSYARPEASTRVTDDAEGAEPVTSTIGLQQYLIEGNLRWYLARPRAGWRPFLRAGGGYLRQLDDSNAHVETGRTGQAGLGLDRAFRDRAAGRVRRVGLRLDARVLARSGGFDVEDTLRIGFSAGALLFVGF